MRNATCAASKTSKVPMQDALLFISYSMVYMHEDIYMLKLVMFSLHEVCNFKAVKFLYVHIKSIVSVYCREENFVLEMDKFVYTCIWGIY